MLRVFGAFLFLLSLFSTSFAQSTSFKIAKLKYNGGGDWYANPSSLPNLIDFAKKNSKIPIAKEEEVVEPSSSAIYQFPYVYMTGHGNVVFSDEEAENLRNYLLAGGFLHIDDNYGMDKYIRKQIKKIFPDKELVELPFSHKIYNSQYNFPKGLPKIHEHDKKPPEGLAIIVDGRVVLFYTYECDLGDGWEDPEVHKDPEEKRQVALKMGLNILIYAFIN